MTTVWIVVAIAAALAFLIAAGSWVRREQDLDLGTVSHHWMAEQRLGQAHDPQR